MAELKVGLAPNRTSFFDKNTNTYITLQKPVQSVFYDESNIPVEVKRLDRITHALLASVPALVLYEGHLPPESVEAFKAKYMKPFHALTTRNVVVGQEVEGKNTPIADQMLERTVVGEVNTNEPLRDGIDYKGAEVKPNRAFDRADAMLNNATPEAPVVEPEAPVVEPEAPVVEPEEPADEPVTASTEKAEEVTIENGEVETLELVPEEEPAEEEVSTEEAPAKKTTTARKGRNTKKAE
jgi:hypothetical protein